MQIQASIGHNQFHTFEVHEKILLEGKIKKGYWSDIKNNATITMYRIKEESDLRYIIQLREKNEIKFTYACDFEQAIPYFISMTEIKEDSKPVNIEKVNIFDCIDNRFFQLYGQIGIWFTRPIVIFRVKGLKKPKMEYEYHYYLTNDSLLPFWVVKLCKFDQTMNDKIPCRNRVNKDGLVKCHAGLSSGSELLEFVGFLDNTYEPNNIEIEAW